MTAGGTHWVRRRWRWRRLVQAARELIVTALAALLVAWLLTSAVMMAID